MTAVRIFAIAGTTDPAEDYRLIDSGLLVPVSALNARSGVTSTPTLTGTGSLTCNVGPFTAAIDGTSNAQQGVYRIAVDGPTAITVTAGASQARVDLIYAQILDNAYDASGQTKGQVQYLAGTPGSGSAPATPANAIPLFTIAVPANATSLTFSTAATAVFPYTAAIGGIVPVRSAADQPPVVSGVQYRHRLDVTAAGSGPSPLESSVNGTTWTPVSNPDGAYGTWTNTTVGGLFNASTQAPQYRTAPGGRIELRGSVTTNGTVAPGIGILGGLPTPGNIRVLPAGAGYGGAYLQIPSGASVMTVQTGAGSVGTGVVFGFDGLSYTL
jgi:hypothetical protein